jgi:hypothetical protein
MPGPEGAGLRTHLRALSDEGDGQMPKVSKPDNDLGAV